jgi:hypothetical protein
MKKSSLFISAVLTTFVLAVIAGVFSAYRSFAGSTPVSGPQSAPSAAAVPAILSSQDAAQIAAWYIGRSDLYAVESGSLNGTSAYKVTFSSGDLVYVNQQGQVLSVVAAPSITTGSNSPFFSPANFGSDVEHDGGD